MLPDSTARRSGARGRGSSRGKESRAKPKDGEPGGYGRQRLILRLPGSSTGTEWQPTFAIDEPLPLVIIGNITILVRLVAA